MKSKYVSWLPAILIMVIIFSFSSKPAVESAESSTMIAEGLLNVYENISGTGLDLEVRIDKLEVVDHIVRKSAHFMEYAVLAIAIAFPLKKLHYLRLAALTVALTALYAATDEIHQLFVPGRSGEIRDVLLDTAGAVFGVLVYIAAMSIANRRRQSK